MWIHIRAFHRRNSFRALVALSPHHPGHISNDAFDARTPQTQALASNGRCQAMQNSCYQPHGRPI